MVVSSREEHEPDQLSRRKDITLCASIVPYSAETIKPPFVLQLACGLVTKPFSFVDRRCNLDIGISYKQCRNSSLLETSVDLINRHAHLTLRTPPTKARLHGLICFRKDYWHTPHSKLTTALGLSVILSNSDRSTDLRHGLVRAERVRSHFLPRL